MVEDLMRYLHDGQDDWRNRTIRRSSRYDCQGEYGDSVIFLRLTAFEPLFNISITLLLTTHALRVSLQQDHVASLGAQMNKNKTKIQKRPLLCERCKTRPKKQKNHDSSLSPSLLIRRNNSTANIGIRHLANMPKSLEPAIARPLVGIVQMITDTVTGRIGMVSGRIVEALARIDAVGEAINPDAEQVVAVAGGQIVAAVELEGGVVFGGAEGGRHAGAVAERGEGGMAADAVSFCRNWTTGGQKERKDPLRWYDCRLLSLRRERAGYTSRHDGQRDRQYQSNGETMYRSSQTTNQAILCLGRWGDFAVVCTIVIGSLFVLVPLNRDWRFDVSIIHLETHFSSLALVV